MPGPPYILVFVTLCWLASSIMPSVASARTIYIDKRVGSKEWTGATAEPGDGDGPVKYPKRAVNQLAKPGDVIFFMPESGPYKLPLECNKSGEPGNPITIEGNGVTFDLRTDLSNCRWSRREDGSWLLKTSLNLKGSPKQKPFKRYQPREDRVAAFYKGMPIYYHTDRGKPAGPFTAVLLEDKTSIVFYFPQDIKPPFAGLFLVFRSAASGVRFRGASHWIIRNVHVRGAGNDGFNYHHDEKGDKADTATAKDIVVENCSAMFNGDEGTSAHEDYEVTVKDSVFAFNASPSGGVNDMMQTQTTYINCISAFNRGVGFQLRSGEHAVVDCLTAGNSRTEDATDLPPSTRIRNLVRIPPGPGLLEKIKAWNPEHPQLSRLLKTVEELKAQGTDLDL